jgi:adenylate kinase family enzyme
VRRVCLVASASGSGKSTVGRELAARLGVPYHELDAFQHIGPNWTEATTEQLRASVEPIVASDAWVIDGTYRGKLGHLVPAAADLVLWLDLAPRVWLPRLLRRTARRVIRREELWNGNRERWRDVLHPTNSVVVYALRTYRATRRELERDLAGYPLVRLRTAREVDALLERAAPKPRS